MNETWLAHHGIKGQRWGVRRYQNKDGSLTEEGLKKYGSVQNAHEVMKKKDKLRAAAFLPMVVAQGYNMSTLLRGKDLGKRNYVATGLAAVPTLLGSIGDIKYRKFLTYYSDELNIDKKKMWRSLRGTI